MVVGPARATSRPVGRPKRPAAKRAAPRSAGRAVAPPRHGGASAAEDVLALQRTVGNQGVVRMLAVKRDDTTTAPAEAELYPIVDGRTHEQIYVTAAEYEVERTHLGNLLRYLTKAIPEDAKAVLDGYPFGEIKNLYQEATENLTSAGQHYAKGELAAARRFAREAGHYTDFESQAHKLLLDKGMLAYVGERVGMAVIGFFEGAAEAVVGMVDTGASLVGFHPDLEGRIKRQYDKIAEAYSDATGVDSTLTSDRLIGRVGGKVAENLATGKVLGKAGRIGAAVNATQAAAGVKGAVEAVVAAREAGRSWGSILGDPVMLSQFAGALAGVAGVAGSGLPAVQELMRDAGLVLTAAQTASLAAALASYHDDPSLSAQANADRKSDVVANLLTSFAGTVDGVHEATTGAAPHEPGADLTEHQVNEIEAASPEQSESDATEPQPNEAQPDGAQPDEQALPLSTPTPYDPAAAGIRPDVAASLQAAAQQLDLVIEVRPVNTDSVLHLDTGALSKMELVKAKTITAVDEAIGAPSGKRGLVGLFKPTLPTFAEGTPPDVVERVTERFHKRSEEYTKLTEYYQPYVAEGLIRVTGGVLEVADPRVAGGSRGRFKAVGGDVDVFDIRHSDGSPLSVDQAKAVTTVLRSMDIGVEHGAHMWWERDSVETFDREASDDIIAQHTQGGTDATQLVAFAPGRPPAPAWAGDRPTGGSPSPSNMPLRTLEVGGERAIRQPDGTMAEPDAPSPTGERYLELEDTPAELNAAMSTGDAAAACTAMANQGGHAIRHLQDDGLVPAKGSLASRVAAFATAVAPVLTAPVRTFAKKLGKFDVIAYYGRVDGRRVVVMVATGGPYAGKVLTAVVPTSMQAAQWGLP